MELSRLNNESKECDRGNRAVGLRALTKEDSDVTGEQRFVTLGMGGKGRVLIVVWTSRGETVRLISAWKANQAQRRRYEQQF